MLAASALLIRSIDAVEVADVGLQPFWIVRIGLLAMPKDLFPLGMKVLPEGFQATRLLLVQSLHVPERNLEVNERSMVFLEIADPKVLLHINRTAPFLQQPPFQLCEQYLGNGCVIALAFIY